MKSLNSLQTVAVIANAAELATGIAKEVLGNDVADMVQGNELTADAIRSLTVAQIQNNFSTYTGGA